MNIIWTLLSTVGVVALAVAGIVAFELTARPGADQRQMVGTAAFVVVCVVVFGLWAWHFRTGRPKRKGGKK